MVDLGTAGLLARHHLTAVPAAEALVLALFGHHRLVLPPAVAPPLQLAAFVVGRRVVLIRRTRVALSHAHGRRRKLGGFLPSA